MFLNFYDVLGEGRQEAGYPYSLNETRVHASWNKTTTSSACTARHDGCVQGLQQTRSPPSNLSPKTNLYRRNTTFRQEFQNGDNQEKSNSVELTTYHYVLISGF